MGQGKGEAIFVRIPPNHWLGVDSLELEADAGSIPAFRLFSQTELNLDCVVLTHPHRDHSLGFRELVEQTNSSAIVGCSEPFLAPPPGLQTSADASQHLSWGAAEDAVMAVIDRWDRFPETEWLLEAGSSITLGEALITCLYPDEQAVERYRRKRGNPNGCSSPLLIRWKSVSLLLGADLPKAGWRHVAKQGHDPALGEHALLKVPHHGSRGAQDACFTACSPDASRLWIVAPWDRAQGPPRFDDKHDVAVMLQSIPEVHLTWLPVATRKLKVPKSRRVKRSAVLAAIERAKFAGIVLEYLDDDVPPRQDEAWVSVGFAADGACEVAVGAAGVVVTE